MKITYIHHSCFCVEFKENKTALVFDYYKGDIPEFSKDMHIYMFASHKHFDHYSKKIFELADRYENITFVLAKEIRMNQKYMDRWNIPMAARDKIIYVTRDDQYELSDLNINTLDSTDSGVAYIVKCCDKVIFHAGDLNWWAWDGQTEAEANDMEKRFKMEVDKLAAYDIDVAFLPLDPRQEDKFSWGFDYYMRKCNIKQAYPMHMWEKYDTVNKLLDLDISKEYRNQIVKYSIEEK